jgi:hypothetical protein
MKIKGKVYCFFEQSGTFKNEFKKLGYAAEDYDIQNNFGETDHVIDLFSEIDIAFNGGVFVIRRDNFGRFNNCILSLYLFLRLESNSF